MNIVDVFMRMGASSQKMDVTRGNSLLKRCILTAFDYDKFDDVDVVYPKNMPSKAKVVQLIKVLQDTPIKNALLTNNEEDNTHLLNLAEVFEQIKQQISTGGDGGNDEPVEVESAPVWTKPKFGAKKR